jgi:hypothetical protein
LSLPEEPLDGEEDEVQAPRAARAVSPSEPVRKRRRSSMGQLRDVR